MPLSRCEPIWAFRRRNFDGRAIYRWAAFLMLAGALFALSPPAGLTCAYVGFAELQGVGIYVCYLDGIDNVTIGVSDFVFAIDGVISSFPTYVACRESTSARWWATQVVCACAVRTRSCSTDFRWRG